MTDAQVTVKGLAELARGSQKLVRRLEARAPADLLPVAERTAASVRGRVPRRSGRMAASVAAERMTGGAQVGYSGSAPYAGWVDFGGGRHAGRPYVAGGRYLYPVALEPGPGPQLADAAAAGAKDEIRGMTWERPS